MRVLLGVLVLALATGACAAKAQAPVTTHTPALQPPSPPARVIVPAPEQPTLPPAEEPPPAVPPSRPAPPAASRPPATTTTPPVVDPPSPPPSLLLTGANAAEFEKRVRAQMARAESDLSQINRQSLGADARGQFDAARGFLRQAEEALKVRNLVFAGQLADKAATLATLLRK